jgi:hypothetical protein
MEARLGEPGFYFGFSSPIKITTMCWFKKRGEALSWPGTTWPRV